MPTNKPILGVYITTRERAEEHAQAHANSAKRLVYMQADPNGTGSFLMSHYREPGYEVVAVKSPERVSLPDRFRAASAAFRVA